MQAIILAGGFGTRLQPIVKDVPKPMAPIAGRPFLIYLFWHLKKCGITQVVLCVGYLQEKIIDFFGDNFLGVKIFYAKEEKPLQTGGAIANALKFLDKKKPIIAINGDTFLQIDYQKLLQFHAQKKSQITLALLQVEDCSRYGSVELDENGAIKNFLEKSKLKKSGLINGGIYVFDSKIFANFVLEKSFSFEADFLAKHLSILKPQGFVTKKYFIDIGVASDYAKAQVELPQLTKNCALFLDRDGVINVDLGYVFEIEKFHFIDGIFELCARAQELGFLIIVATNQAGIAKGFYSEEQFLKLTKWMENEFEKRGIKIAKTFYCPFHVEGKIAKYRQNSNDRKPNAGMLLAAIDQFNIDPKKSIMIGDKESDMLAAKKAGISKAFLISCEQKFPKVF